MSSGCGYGPLPCPVCGGISCGVTCSIFPGAVGSRTPAAPLCTCPLCTAGRGSGYGGSGSSAAGGSGYASGGGGSGYASGGIVAGGGGAGGSYSVTGRMPASSARLAPPGAGRGMPGFADESRDFDLAIGTVTGYRWWALAGPDFSRDPLGADEHWPPALLTGATGKSWEAGVNEAHCNYVDAHEPPVEVDEYGNGCGCGFWAYWVPQSHSLDRNPYALPVVGVIEGSGRTLIGPKGFRSQQARIAALHLPFRLEPDRFVYGGYRRDTLTEAELTVAMDGAHAWMAVIEARLEQMYPGVQIFSELPAMLAAFPADPEYTGPEPPPFHVL